MSIVRRIIGTLVLVAVIDGCHGRARRRPRPAATPTTTTRSPSPTASRRCAPAAGLSSSCEDGCDVDGSGAVTVSDGVNILRKAAGLAHQRRLRLHGSGGERGREPVALDLRRHHARCPASARAPSPPAASTARTTARSRRRRAPTPRASPPSPTARSAAPSSTAPSAASCSANGVVLGFEGYQITRIKTGKSLTFTRPARRRRPQQLGKRIIGTLTVVSSERGTFTLRVPAHPARRRRLGARRRAHLRPHQGRRRQDRHDPDHLRRRRRARRERAAPQPTGQTVHPRSRDTPAPPAALSRRLASRGDSSLLLMLAWPARQRRRRVCGDADGDGDGHDAATACASCTLAAERSTPARATGATSTATDAITVDRRRPRAPPRRRSPDRRSLRHRHDHGTTAGAARRRRRARSGRARAERRPRHRRGRRA